MIILYHEKNYYCLHELMSLLPKKIFSSCKQCSNYFSQSYMPKFAISNNNYLCVPPECMMNLTDVELAMLSITKRSDIVFVPLEVLKSN